MEKLLFVSDIMGTISGANKSDYEALAKQLIQLKEKHGAKEIIFSLCTGDSSASYLQDYYIEAKSVFKNYGITMGRQFYLRGYLEENETGDLQHFQANGEYKIDKIINYTKKMQSDDQIVAVYYTDDELGSSYVNGYCEEKLNDEVYYHFISIGSSHNVTSYNFSSSMKRNVEGVIEAINFHLGTKEIKTANKEFWELRKKEKEEELRIRKEIEEKVEVENKRIEEEKIKLEEEKNKAIELQQEQEKQMELKREKIKLEEEKQRLEVCANNQFVDFKSDDNMEYNKWLNEMQKKFFNTIPAEAIFSDDYSKEFQCYPSTELRIKTNCESYSLFEIMSALSYVDNLTIMLICFDKVNLKYIDDSPFFDGYWVLKGISNSSNGTFRINLSDEENIIEHLMRKEKISLFSLIDTIIAYNITNPDCEKHLYLRSNSCINEDLLERLIEVKNSERYNEITNTLMEKEKALILKPGKTKTEFEQDDALLPFNF